MIEQSEVDAAVEAIRSAFAAPASADEGGPARLIKKLEEILDAPRDTWPPSALRAFWEPLRDAAELRLKGPEARVALVQPGRVLPPAGDGLPARREPDQGPLADLPPGGQARQGPAVLGRLVGPLAEGRRRPEPGPPRGDPPPARRRSSSRPRGARPRRSSPGPSPRPTSWPRSGDAPPRSNGWRRTSRSRSATPWPRTWPGRPCPAYVLWCLGRLGARVPLYGPANTVVPPEKAARWVRALLDRPFAPGRETTDADLRPRAARPGLRRPGPGPRRAAPARGPRPARSPRGRRRDAAARPRVPRARSRPARPGPRRRPADRASAAGQGPSHLMRKTG